MPSGRLESAICERNPDTVIHPIETARGTTVTPDLTTVITVLACLHEVH